MHENDKRFVRLMKDSRTGNPYKSMLFRAVVCDAMSEEVQDGGEGSGNFNHAGRPGEVGGSASSGSGGGSSGGSTKGTEKKSMPKMTEGSEEPDKKSAWSEKMSEERQKIASQSQSKQALFAYENGIAGYDEARYCTASIENALERNLARAAKTGRKVQTDSVVNIHKEVSRIFPQVAKEFDHVTLWDHDGPEPRLVAECYRGQDIQVKDKKLWDKFLAKADWKRSDQSKSTEAKPTSSESKPKKSESITAPLGNDYIRTATNEQLKADQTRLSKMREQNAPLMKAAKEKWYSLPTRTKAQKAAAEEAEKEYQKYSRLDNILGYSLAAIGTEMSHRQPQQKQKKLKHGGGYTYE